jgi:SRSO17 transposase
MKIPCAERLPFIVSGLAFLQPALTNSQFYNLTLIATALVLGSKFCLSEINRMWLKEKGVSTLSHFMSHAKFSTDEMQHLYALQVMHLYKITRGYFIIDDTMQHRTKYCKWIHGVFVLFDHAIGVNLKAVCITVLYFTDGDSIKFPVRHEIYYKDTDNMSWQQGKQYPCIAKYDLAIKMLEWALNNGYPKCTVLADSWFGIGPFIKELKRLKLSYVVEIKNSLTVRTPSSKPKLTPTGKLAKNQYDLPKLPKFFKSILSVTKCGFARDIETGKEAKVLYHVKIATVRLNSIAGKHRVIESFDPTKQTTKYLLTDQLTWEATKIISVYNYRWVIEEFFRNAKQLTDMEGATIRSEQGVTLALCLVSWIDFLLHFENYKQGTAGKLSKESVTIPSIVRRAQYENMEAFLERVRHDEDFVKKWSAVEEENIYRKRKEHKELIELNESDLSEVKLVA